MITNKLEIFSYCHCGKCIEEWKATKPGVSPAEFARLNVGFTPAGLQVWCVRHNVNVMHIDFQGQQHPADLSCEEVPGV
jgi:hypothetical protein